MRLILRRLLTAAAVLTAAAGLMLVPAAPAQAGFSRIVECTDHVNPVTGTIVLDCNWYEIEAIGPHWPPGGCPECAVYFDFWKFDIDPVPHEDFNELLGKGLQTLAKAHLTKDEKLADQLREQAAGLFLEAAKAVEKYPIELYRTGLWDRKGGKYLQDPTPLPWVQTAGEELAAGIALLQADLWDPQPDPPNDAAMQHFDKAYEHLAARAAY
ncbi:hypothetical protein SAMN05216298_0746 [Glycomyces sambucus]|uniref:Uncharacterized protein n=1 Tax=Glycomyces sambucus TaxID=380244 RepID=A0A1G9D8U9_9ACTN|nr:hypothetical protein [Glycomyces sambucus]SDK60356.1 hypothetical protein SAMN05216298_0746 [Glycomyces sambucus]